MPRHLCRNRDLRTLGRKGSGHYRCRRCRRTWHVAELLRAPGQPERLVVFCDLPRPLRAKP